MAAVPQFPLSAAPEPTAPGLHGVPARHRRAVAVAASAVELLRPESDLVRLLESFQEVDLLLASDDVSGPTGGSVHVLTPPGSESLVLDECDDDGPDDVKARAAALELTDLQVHRLGLRPPLGPAAEADMVAAMSELVGFDPEPGVYCLAPAVSPSDAARAAVRRAAQRIAQVYGIPLLRYRCLELSVVDQLPVSWPGRSPGAPG
jgi:hypothetical protein